MGEKKEAKRRDGYPPRGKIVMERLWMRPEGGVLVFAV